MALSHREHDGIKLPLRRDVSFGSCDGLEIHPGCQITSAIDWSEMLQDVRVVIHLAALAHRAKGEVSYDRYQEANVDSTLNLARQAARCGVRRFIFLSSIGVNGNQNSRPFTEEDAPNPQEPYAVSKCDAEKGLLEISRETGMEIVIVRPPLVYGPGAPGNFKSLCKLVRGTLPIPLGCVENRRSLVALDNLVDFIICCINHPKAANETFLISDGEDVSTTELIEKMACAFGVRSRLVPVPVSWMRLAATLLGKRAVADRLFGSLRVDSAKARELLGWKPVVTMDEQLAKIAEGLKNGYS
jgi:nucleoside-diphosphate-sugar epimerase